jgi:hypothetical protein
MTSDATSTVPRPMIEHSLEHVCSYSVDLVMTPEVIGPVPGDPRINAYYAGGEIWGPRMRGRVLPVGADWLTLRTDGVGIVDIRCTLEAEGGALIYVTVTISWSMARPTLRPFACADAARRAQVSGSGILAHRLAPAVCVQGNGAATTSVSRCRRSARGASTGHSSAPAAARSPMRSSV